MNPVTDQIKPHPLMASNTSNPAVGLMKLTDWANEPTLQTLKEDFDSSKQSHDAQVSRINNWNDVLKVRGKHKPPQIKGRSSVQPKLARRQAEWRYPALSEPFLGSDKLFRVDPTTFEDVDAANQNEIVLNWQFRTKMNRVAFVDNYVRSVVEDGTGIVQIGWKRITVKVAQEVPVWAYYPITTQEELEVFQQAVAAREADIRGFEKSAPPELVEAVNYFNETEEPNVAVQTSTTTVMVDKVVKNHPTVEVLSPQNVYIDPSCNGNIDEALFVGRTFETYEAELRKEGDRYKNLDQVDWSSNTPLTTPDHETSTPTDYTRSDNQRRKVVAYELWCYRDIDGTGELKPIVATWIGSVIIRMELNPFPDQKLPFVVVPYLPVKRELFGEPDAELLEDNQKILGATTRGMVDLLGRSANGQMGIAKGMLDPLNKRRWDRGEDYEFNPNLNPQQGFMEHKFPELPSSAIVMLQMQNQDAESLTGVKSFAGGISGESYGDVAAGVRGALDASGKREMSILRRLAKGMQDIGTKIISMNGVFMSEEETIRVTNKDFVTVHREDLIGNFDLIVDISTAEIDNAKAQDLGFMLQTMGPNMDPKISTDLLGEIAKLKRMPALAEKLFRWEPRPDPLAERLKELEIQVKERELEKLNSEIQLNLARANHYGAQTDTENLKFVEQESGTTHAREMQKQAGQAQGNQRLQITKALTQPKKEGEQAPDIEAALGYNELTTAQ